MLRRYVTRRQLIAEWFDEIQDIVTILLAGALIISAIIAVAGCAWMISTAGSLRGLWNGTGIQGMKENTSSNAALGVPPPGLMY